jgi:hypothetical protein
MKSKHQVSVIIKTLTGTEKDALAIESFLFHHTIYIKFTPEQLHNPELETVTYEQFKKWFDEDSPEPGDVIVINHLIGIVKKTGIHSVTLGVSLRESGEFFSNDIETPRNVFRLAGEEETLRLQRALNDRQLTWSNFKQMAVKSVSLENNLQLRITRLGKKIGVGVFREINGNDEIVMYCVKEVDHPVRYSLYEVIGPVSDYQLEPVSILEREKLANDLEKAGKLWNGHAKRIEPVNLRCEKGGKYYYIGDFFEITTTYDKYKPKDIKRLRSGNYFKRKADAEEVLSSIIQKRNRQLIDNSK